jgi:TonB family protein
VTLLNTSLVRFFFVSVAVHTLLFSFIHLGRHVKIAPQDPIAVSLWLAPEKEQATAPTPIPRAPSRSSKVKAHTVVAKKDSPVTKERSVPAQEKTVKNDTGRQDSIPAAPSSAPPSEPIREKTVVAERELPTVKDLLPPLTWSSSNSRVSAPVSLNTKDPIFVSYFNKIKQLIESEWEYPELALRYGLQGKLSLEFTIAKDGQLAQVRLVRSSGSQLLDEEAIRAIKAAAPFPPIPPWIKPNPLPISASMEYHDNRLNYGFGR